VSLDRDLADLPLFIHYLHDPEETPEKDLQADIYLPLRQT
jgi:DNA gyrase inhibitor GyrI